MNTRREGRGVFSRLLSTIGIQTKDGSGTTGSGTLSSPDAWLFELFSGGIEPTIAGVAVNPINAMECSAVRCAVQSISETCAQLPLEVYESDANNTKTLRADHPAYRLLGPRGQVNPWTPRSTLIERVTRDALLYPFGGFAEIIRNSDGVPIELHHIDRLFEQVEPTWLEGDTEPNYVVTSTKQAARNVSWRNMLHLPCPSQWWGVCKDAKNAIALAIVLERHGLTLFGKGARPGGVLTFPAKLDAPTSLRMKQSWQAAHGGSANGGGTAILEEGAKWEALAFTSTDSQYIELRTFCVEEIARHFRIAPTFLMDYRGLRSSSSGLESIEGQFLGFTIVPWLVRWEGEIALKLFADDERQNLTAAFNTNAVARADFLARMQGYSVAIASRVLNPNEARNFENLPAFPGGDEFKNPNTTAFSEPVVPK